MGGASRTDADGPDGHARAGRIDVAEIKGAQLILFDRKSSYYDVTNALFRVAGVVPRGVTEVDNIEAASGWSNGGSASRCFPGRQSRVERLGSRPTSPFLDTLWGLLERIPEFIPRALPIAATD